MQLVPAVRIAARENQNFVSRSAKLRCYYHNKSPLANNAAPIALQIRADRRWTPLWEVAEAAEPRVVDAALELLEERELEVDEDPIPGDL